MEVSVGLAFVAGVLSFVSPCVLALVPVYLAYLGETAVALPGSRAGGGAVIGAGLIDRSLLGQVLLFTLSFGAIFVLLGVSVGLLGANLFRLIPHAREATGLLVVAMGLAVTGVFGPILSRVDFRFRLEALPDGRSARSVLLGALFALGWSPCIGPVLGAILTMGASSQDVGAAALLLSSYSLGLALPFVLAAVALPQLRPIMVALRRWHRPVEITAGLFIAAMGILIYLNAFTRMASLFTWTI
ncbi:MAG: cytochrome c biogenesis protein CcdA [Chloroflexota bacterium]|nr:cytochrome c biogenesis protein CcdA [Chloroflexota bacterium]